ncbi:MAG: hypothetical protein IH977_12255 [Nitrospinae bacterium]|nr:hypothetical protein [Nitrospinota bacterium]MEC4670549.1 hypothetical protein [Nitrospirota bacterium]
MPARLREAEALLPPAETKALRRRTRRSQTQQGRRKREARGVHYGC